jgi:hypothetical protein
VSVQCTLFVMLCAPVPMPKGESFDEGSSYERYEPLMEGSYDAPLKGLSICYDGMSGKYCYAGYTLLKSKELMGQDFEFHGKRGYVTDLPTPTMQEVIEVKNLIQDKLGVEVQLKDIAVRIIFHYG